MDFKVSRLIAPYIYNVIEDYNYLRIKREDIRGSHFLSSHLISEFKGLFFQKLSNVYYGATSYVQPSIADNLRRSPGLCKMWIKDTYL